MSYSKEMVIFFAILLTEKALLNFCYSIIYYSVDERAGFSHSSPHQEKETNLKNKFLKWDWTSGSHYLISSPKHLPLWDVLSQLHTAKALWKQGDVASRALLRCPDLAMHFPMHFPSSGLGLGGLRQFFQKWKQHLRGDHDKSMSQPSQPCPCYPPASVYFP